MLCAQQGTEINLLIKHQQLVVKSSTRSPVAIAVPDGAQLVVNRPVSAPLTMDGVQLVVNKPVPAPQCRVWDLDGRTCVSST